MRLIAMKAPLRNILLLFTFSCGIASVAAAEDTWVPPPPAGSQPSEVISPGAPLSVANDALPLSPSWPATPADTPSFNSELQPFLVTEPLSQTGWFVRGETMFLHLSHSSNQPLAYDLVDVSPGAPGAIVAVGPVVTTNSIASNRFEAVPRATLGYRFGDGTAVEAVYFGRNDWSGSASAVSSPLGIPSVIYIETPDTFAADKVNTSLATTLHNAELNTTRIFANVQGLEFLSGFRYFRLNDQFQLNTQRTANGDLYQGNYNVRATNNLLGGQIGLRWTQTGRRWSFSGTSKSGIYVNNVEQFQSFMYSQNSNGLAIRDLSMSRSEAAFIQELGLNAGYQITPAWSIRAGYNLFLITGLARAGNQLDFSPNSMPSLNTHGTTVLHGPSAGIEFRF